MTTVAGSIGYLLRGQLGHMNTEYEVVALSSSEPPGTLEKFAELQGIRAIVLPMTRKITPLKDLWAIFKLYRILKREKPLFVHTHTPKAGLVGMAAAFLSGVPYRMHDIAGLPLLVAKGFRRQVLIWVERLTYAMATQVYPNSPQLCAIAKELNLAKPKKLLVLGHGSSNGINTSFFDRRLMNEGDLRSLKASLGIDPGDVVFIFIGRLVGDKGINELVEAFTLLSEEFSNIKLLLVGQYEKHLDPIKKSTDFQIQNHPKIIFVGGQKDVRPYLAISDVLSFPSYREGFPNVPMEAASMGLPCIVTDINGCNEIISHGINGLIIPPQQSLPLLEAMRQLVDDADLRHNLAKNARKMIQEKYEQTYVWNLILKEYQRLETQYSSK